MIESILIFFFNDTATTEIYTLSLHDALPIYPPGSVPHHSVPGSVSCPASSAHTSSVLQGMGLPELGSRSSIPSGLGGYTGVAHGSHLRPPSRERCSLTPKCPCPSATYTAPSRRSGSTIDALSARKCTRVIAQRARGRPLRRSSVKTPLRVATASLRCARSWICRPLTNTTMWRRTPP